MNPVRDVILFCLLGWLTHVIYCFATDAWLPLIVGALAFPLGVLHGWWIAVRAVCQFIAYLFGVIF